MSSINRSQPVKHLPRPDTTSFPAVSNDFLYYFKGSLRSPRGPARRRADAPVSAPLRPGRRPARGREPQEEGTVWLGRSAPRL